MSNGDHDRYIRDSTHFSLVTQIQETPDFIFLMPSAYLERRSLEQAVK